MGCIKYEFVGQPVSWGQTSETPNLFHFHFDWESLSLPNLSPGEVRKAAENLQICFLRLLEERMRAGSFVFKDDFRNLNFSTCGTKTNPSFQ